MGKEQMEKIQSLRKKVANLKEENDHLREEVRILRTRIESTLSDLLGDLSDQMDEVKKQSNKTQSSASLAKISAEQARMSNQAITARTTLLACAAVSTVLWAYTIDWTSMSGVADLQRVLRTGGPRAGPVTFAAWGAYGLFEVVHRYMLPAFSSD